MDELQKALAAMGDNLAQQAQINKAILDKMESEKAGTVGTANLLHGNVATFNTPGLDQTVITAHIRPSGISSMIPMFPSVDETPFYSILTGFSGEVGSQPANICDAAPTGTMKACTTTAKFGHHRQDTNTIQANEVMKRRNRGDFTDLQLAGQVVGLTDLTPRNLTPSQVISLVTMSEMIGAGIRTERNLVRQMWQGTVAVTGDFPGLDVQIATGHIDAETSDPCPAVDSDIKDFTYEDVATSTAKSIVEYMSMLEWFIYFNAERMGLLPVNWVWVMRPELWQILTEVWPCQYNTNRCASAVQGTASRVVIDGRDNIADRDSMRSSMTIEVNGRTYPVRTDDGIHEQNNVNDANLNPGEYASSIYFVPMTILGNFPVLFRQHMDYSAWAGDVALLNGTEEFWTDGGQFSWAATYQKWCYQLHLLTEQRIVLRTPHLAGKIQNVKYIPLQHLRSAFPDSEYWKDGGASFKVQPAANAVFL